MTVTGGNVGRGKAYGDMSGYNLTFTGREQRAALALVLADTAGDSVFSGLSSNAPTIVTA